MRGLAGACMLLALLAAPAASAEPVPIESRLSATGPLRATGNVTADLDLAGLRMNGEEALVAGFLEAGTLLVLKQSEIRTHTSSSSPIGELHHLSRGPDHEAEQAELAGALGIRPLGSTAFLLALPSTEADTIRLTWHGDLELMPGAKRMDWHNGTTDARGRTLAPVEPYQTTQVTLRDQSLSGGMVVLASNVALETGDGTRAFSCSDQSTPRVGWSNATVRTCDLLVLYVHGGHFTLDGTAQLSVARAHLRVHGAVSILGAAGPANLDPALYDGRAALFEATGTFRLEGQAKPGAATEWSIEGQATSLRLDARAIPLGLGAPAVVGGAALGLLGLAWALLRSPGLLLGFRATPDGNPVRRALLQAVHASPGITLQDAAATLRVHKTTAQYHAQVLHRHGLLHLHRLANRTHLSPRGNDPLAIVGAAIAQQQIRGRLLAALRSSNGPVRASDIRAGWPTPSPPSDDLLGYHLRVLMRSGLVERRGMGRYATWCLREPGRPQAAIAAEGA